MLGARAGIKTKTCAGQAENAGAQKIKTKTSAGQNLNFLDKIQIIIDYLRHIFIVESSYQNWIDDQTKEIHA